MTCIETKESRNGKSRNWPAVQSHQGLSWPTGNLNLYWVLRVVSWQGKEARPLYSHINQSWPQEECVSLGKVTSLSRRQLAERTESWDLLSNTWERSLSILKEVLGGSTQHPLVHLVNTVFVGHLKSTSLMRINTSIETPLFVNPYHKLHYFHILPYILHIEDNQKIFTLF